VVHETPPHGSPLHTPFVQPAAQFSWDDEYEHVPSLHVPDNA
jgi:hypothetical protein